MENLSSHAGYVRGWVRVMLNDGAIANVLNMLCDGESAELLHFHWVLPNSYIFTPFWCKVLWTWSFKQVSQDDDIKASLNNILRLLKYDTIPVDTV